MTGKLIEDEAIKQLITTAWEGIFKTSGKVIQHSGLYGFDGMALIPNPNIHQMMRSVKILAGMIAEIVDTLDAANVEPDYRRLVINTQEQVRRLERVASALIADDREVFNEAIEDLKKQAHF